VEVHLVYLVLREPDATRKSPRAQPDPTEVTFSWTDDRGEHTASQVMIGRPGDKPWAIPTEKNVRTKWVEFRPAARPE